MEIVMPEIFQVILTNFGFEKYSGPSLDEAKDCAVWCGFEATVLKDGTLIAAYSPISGWKNY